MRKYDVAECGGQCGVMVSVGVMVSGWNGGEIRGILLTQHSKQSKSFNFRRESEKTSLTKYTQWDLLIYRRKDFLLVLEKKVTKRNQGTDEGPLHHCICLGQWQCLSAGPFMVYPWRIATCWVSVQELHCWRRQYWEKSQLLATVVRSMRKTQKEGATRNCAGKRNKIGPQDQRCKAPGLKNPSVNFTVTETSIIDLVNVEGSMGTMRWYMTIIHTFVCLLHGHYSLLPCGKYWADHERSQDNKTDSTFRELSDWREKERLYFQVWPICYK